MSPELKKRLEKILAAQYYVQVSKGSIKLTSVEDSIVINRSIEHLKLVLHDHKPFKEIKGQKGEKKMIVPLKKIKMK